MELRRYRRLLAKLCLGAWLFALGVGMAYACALHTDAPPARTASALCPADGGDEHTAPPGCADSCTDQAAAVTNLQPLQALPFAPVILPSLTVIAPARRCVPPDRERVSAEPPPDQSLSIRLSRLQL